MGQYRKATVRIFPDAKLFSKDLSRVIGITEKAVTKGTDQGIEEYLNHLKGYAMNNHPWKDRTGNLRNSHEVIKTNKGYALKADPRAAGRSDYDYGGLLEFGKEKGLAPYSKDYSWIRPAHKMLKPRLDSFVLKNILKNLTSK